MSEASESLRLQLNNLTSPRIRLRIQSYFSCELPRSTIWVDFPLFFLPSNTTKVQEIESPLTAELEDSMSGQGPDPRLCVCGGDHPQRHLPRVTGVIHSTLERMAEEGECDPPKSEHSSAWGEFDCEFLQICYQVSALVWLRGD